MLPKQITPEAIIKIAWRRKFQILVPFVLAVMAGVFLVVVLPRTYQAETLILVQAQRVPEQYVRATVTIDAGGRLATISQQVMSRTRLEKVIRDLNLYPELLEQYPMEKIVGIIRDKIELKVGDKKRRNDDALTSFTIAFTHHDPVVAAKVVNTLASLFIEEHLKVREEQAMGTTTFLERELELQKKKLEEQEKAIEEFKQHHMGELPEQLPSNIGSLQRFQEELSAVQASLSAARDRRVTIQGQMAQTEQGVRELDAAKSKQSMVVNDQGVVVAASGDDQIETLRSSLAALRTRYTDEHPMVKRARMQLEKAEAQARERQAAAEQAEASQPKTPVPASSPVETVSSESARLLMAYQTHLNQLQQELQSVSSEIARLLTREEQLYEQIKLYQARVDNTPQREQQLMSLTRDYTITMENYRSLLGRQLEAKMAENLERMQKGEQFIVLDPAVPPKLPVSPDVRRILMACLLLGLVGGFGLAGLLEFTDRSFQNDQTLVEHLGLPVLATFPLIQSDGEKRRKKILGVAATVASLVIVAGYSVGILIIKSKGITIDVFRMVGLG